MAIFPPSLSCLNQNEGSSTARRSAHFHPTVWGDHFIHSSSQLSDVESIKQRVEELKEVVKRMLLEADTMVQKMNLVDAIQRLGVAYNFDKEIEQALHSVYNNNVEDNDLNVTALRFRLLRQAGYNVTSDVFCQFKDKDGSFRPILNEDARGLLSLYEASHLSVEGEDILDEALAFSSEQLKCMSNDLEICTLARQVKHALELPLHKNMPRLEARYYISVYEEEEAKNDVLLELAKLDFNLLQSFHHSEIREISRWYKDLDLTTKLPFARDRVVECYLWMLGAYSEPQFSLRRMQLTKIGCMLTVADDMYDVYATIEELKLFTEAIERWDLGAIDQLPEYMKVFYVMLYNTTMEIEFENMKELGSNNIHYFKKAFIDICKAYFAEAQWFNARHVPTLEDYLSVATTTSTYPVFLTAAAIGMGDITKEELESIVNVCEAVKFTSVIARLLDDTETTKEEQERGDVASSIQCYMNEYGVSEQEAHKEIRKLVAKEWKKLNKECLQPTTLLPRPLIKCIVNLARTAEVFYQYGDGYGTSTRETKDRITSLLVQPIPI